MLSVKYLIPSIRYHVAENLIERGQYDEAIAAFAKLGDYKDSSQKAPEIYYKKGVSMLEAGNYGEARSAFTECNNYGDAADRILETHYRQGESAIENGNYEIAAISFSNAQNYSDALIRVKESYYKMAEIQLESGDFLNARSNFIKADDYGDAVQQTEQINETFYCQGVEAVKQEDYKTAVTILEPILDFSDSESYYNYATIKSTNYSDGKSHSLKDLLYAASKIEVPDLREEILALPQCVTLHKLVGKWGGRYTFYDDGTVDKGIIQDEVFFKGGGYYAGHDRIYNITSESIYIAGETYK